MKFSKNDAIFSAAILVGIAALSALLYLHTSARSAGKGEAIGKVFYKREVAMRKFSDRMVWEDVESGTPLYSHDAVMTGSYSDAELVLNTGLKLKLEANTLVELDLEQEGLTLKLSGGGIKTAGAQNSQTTVLTKNGQSINVTEASASIRTQGSQVAVEVKEGKVEVTNKEGKKETVVKDEVLTAGKKMRVALQLTLPADETQFLTNSDNARIPFACAPQGSAKSIELAQNADFAGVRRVPLANGAASPMVSSGDWFVRCLGDEGSSSAMRRIRVVKAGSYQLIRPEKNEINFTDKPSLRIEFRTPRAVTSTKVEIADNPQFLNPVFAQTVARSFVDLALPKSGRYHFRLTPANDTASIESQLAPYVGSVVLSRAEKAVPVAFLSVAAPSFSLAQVESGKAFISYEGSGIYRFEIVNRPDGKIIQTGKTKAGVFALPVNLTGGKYELRLSSGNEKVAQAFEVRDKIKVDLLAPENGTTLYLPLGEKTTSLALSWRGSSDVALYQIVIAEDASFKNVMKKINVDATEFRFTGLTPRKYYLKVLALENNIPRAETSTINVIVEKRLPPVSDIYPRDDQKVDISRTSGLNLKWEPVTGANSYEVKIYQKRRGNLVLVDSRVTKGANLTFADVRKLHEGNAVVEVRAQQVDRSGGVVQKSEPVRSNVNISFGPTPPAPEVVPIVEE